MGIKVNLITSKVPYLYVLASSNVGSPVGTNNNITNLKLYNLHLVITMFQNTVVVMLLPYDDVVLGTLISPIHTF